MFNAVSFIWPPSRAAPIGCKFALRLRAPKFDPPRLASSIQLTNFLQISPKSSMRFRCVMSPTPCHPVPSSQAIVTCPPRTHVTTYIKVCT